jgi:hypothetical protein
VLDDVLSHSPTLRLEDERDGVLALGRVEATHHLVEQEQPGPRRQNPRHLQLFPLADREPPGEGRRLVLELHVDELLARELFRHPQVARPAQRPDDDVVEHGHLRQRPDLLPRTRHPELADAIRREAGDGPAVEEDLPSRRRVEAGDAVEQRRLPCAVRPDEAEDRALFHREGHVRVRGEAAEELEDSAHLEERRHHASPWSTGMPAPGRRRRAQSLRTKPSTPSGMKTIVAITSRP